RTAPNEEAGGFIGSLLAMPLVHFFDVWASLVILIGIAFIALVITADSRLSLKHFLFWRKESADEEADNTFAAEKISPEKESAEESKKKEEPIEDEEEKPKKNIHEKAPKIISPEKSGDDFAVSSRKFLGKTFTPPPITLLEEDRGKPG